MAHFIRDVKNMKKMVDGDVIAEGYLLGRLRIRFNQSKTCKYYST